jgi:CheY-like chemotaxis protein/HPt (histidine-containing phosphotransfer) domain-containing protein
VITKKNEEVNIKTRGLELKYDLEEIKKEKLAAEKSIVLKDKFLAGITHELRTPLNGIVGLADVLSDSAVTPEQREYVSTIRNSAYNILSVINDLLDYARLNTQQIKAEEVVFDFLQLVDSLSKNFPAGKLIISVPDQKLAVKRNLIADKNIIYKLISHILDYAHTNNTAGDISLSYELHNTGRIPLLNFKIFFSPRHSASQMASIFEIQVDEQYTASAKANTGLGLNIARQFASLINGSISFIDDNSESFFSVTLPVKIADKIITLHDDGIKQDEKKADHLYKILLVEDNKVNQFLAKTMLVKSGFYVDVATDGNDAIEKLSQTGYDFVLTDVQMPGMNGYDLARYIRSKFTKPLCDIPIIALTAYESAIEKDKAKESGMTDYLTKPYNLNDLVTVIQKYKNKPSKTSGTSDEIISIEQTVSHLEGLVLNSKKDLRNLIEMLCEQIPQLTDEIEAAVKIKDWDAVFKAAHKLKSSVNLLEVKTLNEAIETIETNAMKKINTDDIASLLKNFKDNSSKVVKLLKTYR